MKTREDLLADSLRANILVGIHDIQRRRVSNLVETEIELRALLRVFRVAEFAAVSEGEMESSEILASTRNHLEEMLDNALAQA